MKILFVSLVFITTALGCTAQNKKTVTQPAKYEIIKTDAEWKKILTPLQFEVTRKAGTEQAYSGIYWDNHKEGIYIMNSDGSDVQLLLEKGNHPDWSPDQRQIVFMKNNGIRMGIYKINIDGSGMQKITPDSLDSFFPVCVHPVFKQ